MIISKHPKNGNLKISEEVVVSIVKEAIMEIDGAAELSPVPVSRKEYLIKAKKPKPVIVDINDGTVKITVGISVKRGYAINPMAEEIQKAVKDAIQSMTGIAVYKVNIYIAGIK